MLGSNFYKSLEDKQVVVNFDLADFYFCPVYRWESGIGKCEWANFLIKKKPLSLNDVFFFVCEDSISIEKFLEWFNLNVKNETLSERLLCQKILNLPFVKSSPYSTKCPLIFFLSADLRFFLKIIIQSEFETSNNWIESIFSSISFTGSRFFYRQPFFFFDGDICCRISSFGIIPINYFFPAKVDFTKNYSRLFINPCFQLGNWQFEPLDKFFIYRFYRNSKIVESPLLYKVFYQPFILHTLISRPYFNFGKTSKFKAFSVLEPVSLSSFFKVLKSEYTKDNPWIPFFFENE